MTPQALYRLYGIIFYVEVKSVWVMIEYFGTYTLPSVSGSFIYLKLQSISATLLTAMKCQRLILMRCVTY